LELRRKTWNDELRDLYRPHNIFRIVKCRTIRRAGYVARIGKTRNEQRILLGKRLEKRRCGKLKRRRQDEIKVGIRTTGCEMGSARNWLRIVSIDRLDNSTVETSRVG
jgi:hypothetical protein